MEFELTPEITDEIVFSMEDQTGHFLYDSAECRCVATRDCPDEDDDRYYAIPVWDSISGFRMMDRFVAQLRNPVVREELRAALSSGHGVFRSFKNILKNHAEVERLWFQFKEREMKNIVLEWYNNLRDFWGLDRIGAEPEETTDLVSLDFTFRPGTADDEEGIEALLFSLDEEIADSLPPDLAASFSVLWDRIRYGEGSGENEHMLLAESPDGELLGCSISAPLPDDSLKTVQITLIFVYPEFRGLGIGKELLSRTIQNWAQREYHWLLLTCPFIPPIFRPTLQRTGFTEKGLVPVVALSEAHCH